MVKQILHIYPFPFLFTSLRLIKQLNQAMSPLKRKEYFKNQLLNPPFNKK